MNAAIAQHVAAPWGLLREEKDRFIILPVDGIGLPRDNAIVTVQRPSAIWSPRISDGEARATAHLVMAAPRLLEQLKIITALAERYGVGNDCDGNIIEAREVIALAEGRTP